MTKMCCAHVARAKYVVLNGGVAAEFAQGAVGGLAAVTVAW
jgi:hypothetical protein